MQLDRLEPGARLGTYVVTRRLGAGGMGVVYEARDERLGRLVALKVPSKELMTSAAARARFEREARAAAAVVHPNVVGIHGVGEVHGWPIVAFEHVARGSLRELIGRQGRVAWREAGGLARGLARGLVAIHAAGLVHRDLKPENVLLDALGIPKIADLGLVRDLRAAEALTRTGDLLGTPTYMAPEQLDQARDAGPPADVYALGCILFELLAGHPPFRGSGYEVMKRHLTDPVPAVRSEVEGLPPALERLVTAMLAKEPAGRPTAERVIADLAAIDEAPVARATPTSRAIVAGALLVAAGAIAVAALARGVVVVDPAPAVPPARPATPVIVPPDPTTHRPEPPPTGRRRTTTPDARSPDWALKRLQPGGGLDITPAKQAKLLDARGGYSFNLAGGATSVAVCSASRTVLTGDSAGMVRAWDLDSGEERWSRLDAGQFAYVAMDGRGTRAVVTTADGLLMLDMERGEPIGAPAVHGLGEVISLAMSPDGERAVAGNKAGQVAMVDLRGGRAYPLDLPGEPGAPVPGGRQAQVAISADGRQVLAGDRTGRLRSWRLDPDSWATTSTELASREPVRGLVATPDLAVFLTANDEDGRVLRWTGRDGGTLVHQHGQMRCMALTANGLRALVGDNTGTLLLIDLEHPGAPTALAGAGGSAVRVAAFVDASHAVSCDRRVLVWDLDRPDRVSLPDQNVHALASSGDGRRLIVARETCVEVWAVEPDALRCVRSLPSPERDPLRIALSLDGRQALVCWDNDGTPRARSLDVTSGAWAPADVAAFEARARGWAGPSSITLRVEPPTVDAQRRDGAEVTLTFAPELDQPAAAADLGDGTVVVGTARGALLRFRLGGP